MDATVEEDSTCKKGTARVVAYTSTAQHSTAQPSPAQHSTAHHSAGQRSTAQRSMAQHSTAECNNNLDVSHHLGALLAQVGIAAVQALQLGLAHSQLPLQTVCLCLSPCQLLPCLSLHRQCTESVTQLCFADGFGLAEVAAWFMTKMEGQTRLVAVNSCCVMRLSQQLPPLSKCSEQVRLASSDLLHMHLALAGTRCYYYCYHSN